MPFVAPRPGVEQVIATVWGDLLDTPPIEVDDDFFRLGGHSLLAMQVITRLRAIFQVAVAVRAFFGRPTIAGVARAVGHWKPGLARPSRSPESGPGSRPKAWPYVLTALITSRWFPASSAGVSCASVITISAASGPSSATS